MQKKLDELYQECIQELEGIGIPISDETIIGKIDIQISTRSKARYGCCKQEEPDESTKYIEKRGYRRIIRYNKYQKHHIEISSWVMELDKAIIKNTIMHELIHCIPFCNNHGKEFKQYAKLINEKLGYDITRVGNKKEDYQKSQIEYQEEEQYRYKIVCQKCGQEFYRKRLNKNFASKYRCGKCRGKFKIITL